MQQQLMSHPLTLCGQEMKQETSAKYLGDWLSCLGLAESVEVTVKKRKGLATLAIFEIRAIIEDCRQGCTKTATARLMVGVRSEGS